MMNKFSTGLLTVCVFALALSAGCEKPRKSSNFDQARRLVLQGQYDAAISSLEEQIKLKRDSRHASRAGLFLFKANFAKGNYEEAKKWCQWTIDEHPESLEATKCKFKLGLVLMAQEAYPEALQRFETIAASTDNPLRPEATFFVSHLKTIIAKQDAQGGQRQ